MSHVIKTNCDTKDDINKSMAVITLFMTIITIIAMVVRIVRVLTGGQEHEIVQVAVTHT